MKKKQQKKQGITKLDEIDVEKDIGVIIDNYLAFDNHIKPTQTRQTKESVSPGKHSNS